MKLVFPGTKWGIDTPYFTHILLFDEKYKLFNIKLGRKVHNQKF